MYNIILDMLNMDIKLEILTENNLTFRFIIITPPYGGGIYYPSFDILNIRHSYLKWKHLNEYIKWGINHSLQDDIESWMIDFKDEKIIFKIYISQEELSVTIDHKLCEHLFKEIEEYLFSSILKGNV